MTKLIMLGTGHATVTKIYNSCFVLKNERGAFLVDAGGGNGILRQMERAQVDFEELSSMFVTHAHTDHLGGVIWVLRMLYGIALKGGLEDGFTVYCHDEVKAVLDVMCRYMLTGEISEITGGRVRIQEVKDGDKFSVSGMDFTVFDILSKKKKQFGFTVEYENGKRLTCLGDESYNEKTEPYAKGAHFLMADAFCLECDRDGNSPGKKSHSTAKESAKVAKTLGVKNLILYHTEENRIEARKTLYTAEAETEFTGNIFVPDDLDEIEL